MNKSYSAKGTTHLTLDPDKTTKYKYIPSWDDILIEWFGRDTM